MADAKWRGFPQGGAIDFGRTAADYERYRPGFPDAFFDRLSAEQLIRPGMTVLDLGTGTGAMALGLARRGSNVTALDRSPELLEVLARRAAAEQLAMRIKQGVAEDTGEEANRFDLVTAAQCWWWFDPVRTTREVRRVLIPGGRMMIASFCYLPLPGSMAEQTEALILKHNPGWSAAACQGVFPEQLTQLAAAGFEDLTSFSYDVDVVFTHESWRGRIRACNGVAASMTPEEVARFDGELAALLGAHHPAELHVLHRVFVVSAISRA